MKKTKNGITFLLLAFVAACVIFFIKLYMDGKFDSVDTLKEYMEGFGIFAPLVLTVIQVMQVIVPVLPGWLGCSVGAVLFGTIEGFWCNYIGISVGSIIAYFLAKKYGVEIVLLMFGEEKYDKWSAKVADSANYGRFLFIATLLPLFPDDFLCYFSGLINMNSRKFIWIIILGKPWCILAYSIIFGLI